MNVLNKVIQFTLDSMEWLYDTHILHYIGWFMAGVLITYAYHLIDIDAAMMVRDNGDGTETQYTARFHKRVVAVNDDEQ